MRSLQPITPERSSLRRSINAMCRSCIYDRFAPGTWRQQVEACSCPACALFPVRPVSKTAGKAPRIDADGVLA